MVCTVRHRLVLEGNASRVEHKMPFCRIRTEQRTRFTAVQPDHGQSETAICASSVPVPGGLCTRANVCYPIWDTTRKNNPNYASR